MAKKDYEVGYGKPPKSGQFKPGQSGNPNGRPKGAKNFKTVLEGELLAKVPIKEHGKVRKVQKQEAMVKAVLQKAMQGDVKAFNALVAAAGKFMGDALTTDDAERLSATDQMIVDEFLKHMEGPTPVLKKGPKT